MLDWCDANINLPSGIYAVYIEIHEALPLVPRRDHEDTIQASSEERLELSLSLHGPTRTQNAANSSCKVRGEESKPGYNPKKCKKGQRFVTELSRPNHKAGDNTQKRRSSSSHGGA